MFDRSSDDDSNEQYDSQVWKSMTIQKTDEILIQNH